MSNTPRYIYDHNKLRENIEAFNVFNKNNISILYSVKSNNYKKLINTLIDCEFGFEVASAEELEYVIRAGADPNQVSFSAPSKTFFDIQSGKKHGVKLYVFDTIEEAKKIIKVIKDPILIGRIATPNNNSVYDLSSVFGMTNEYLHEVMQLSKKEGWPFRGITFHVGSQNVAINSWINSFKRIDEIYSYAKKIGINFDHLNIGGGFPVQYRDKVDDLNYYANKILNHIVPIRDKYNIQTILMEPGRSISATTMDLECSVINIKRYKKPMVLVVDTSVFNGVIEAVVDFEYNVVPSKQLGREKIDYKIMGNSCDSNDVLVKSIKLPMNLKIGDKLLFKNAGAYTFVYENFHMRKFPEISCRSG